jgi:hypothetical protein
MRSALIKLLCVTLAFVGIAGSHEHLAITGEHGAGHHENGGHAVEVFSELDAHHADSHAGGDVDLEPAAKASGKIPVAKVSLAIAFMIAGLSLLAIASPHFVRRRVLAGEPRARILFSLLPPSHAPPVAAFAR